MLRDECHVELKVFSDGTGADGCEVSVRIAPNECLNYLPCLDFALTCRGGWAIEEKPVGF